MSLTNSPHTPSASLRRLAVLCAALCSASILIFAQGVPSQSGRGSVSGYVVSREGEPLVGASIRIPDTNFGAATTVDGRFQIPNLPAGSYTLEVSYIGYRRQSRNIQVAANRITTVEFVLAQEAFQIGEIEVVAERPLLPTAAESKTTISSAEIEHFQASSVGDILDIVPGIQKTANPGLGKTVQVGLRGEQTDALTSFGTKIMIDGVPVSNNANLQFEKWAAAATGPSNVGSGVDLRMIPADNLENVEVIRGLPSVKYGELTSGLINIKTRTGVQPHRLKIKTNPDTREANMGGGFLWAGQEWSYNLNGAQSERDIRKDGDEYARVTGQMVVKSRLLEDALTISNKLYGQRIFDEDQPKDDPAHTRNYNRGYSINYALTGSWKTDEVSSVDFNAYVNYRRENSMRSKLVTGSLRILPTGDTISSYMGKVQTHGDEWGIGGRLEWLRTFFPGAYVHQVLLGSEVSYDANTGDGVLIDSLYNYYGAESGRRSYRFDDIPSQVIASLYAEDKITGNLLVDFSWVFGARYEMYHPTGLNFKGLLGKADLVRSRHGSYFNPRTSLILFLEKGTQLRLSAGVVTKSPPMSTLYPPPDLYEWRNPDLNETMQFRFNRWAPDLRAYRERQFELGYDQSLFGLVGMSLSAYYKERDDQPRSVEIPVFVWTNVNNVLKLYYVTSDSRVLNAGWNISKGIEVSLRTRRIDALNLDFTIVGSYNFTREGSRTLAFDETPDTSIGQIPNNVVSGPVNVLFGYWYQTPGRWTDNILLNYYVRYTVPALGLWATLRIEHLVWRRRQDTSLEPVDKAKLTPTSLAQRWFDEAVREEPAKFLINLNISKSLFRGAEVSFYVNNVLDDPAIFRRPLSPTPNDTYDEVRNPDLFYGLEFSFSLDAIFR